MVKKVTLENLAEKMDKGFKGVKKHTDKKIDEKIDELALAVAKGFQGVDKRFEKVDERFDKADEKFRHIDARLGTIEADISEIKKEKVVLDRFEDLKCRVDFIEEKVGIVS